MTTLSFQQFVLLLLLMLLPLIMVLIMFCHSCFFVVIDREYVRVKDQDRTTKRFFSHPSCRRMSHLTFQEVVVLTFLIGLISLNGPAILQSSTRSCLLWITVQHLPPSTSFIWRFLLWSNHTTNEVLWTAEWEERKKEEVTATAAATLTTLTGPDGGGGGSSKIQAIPSVDVRADGGIITADKRTRSCGTTIRHRLAAAAAPLARSLVRTRRIASEQPAAEKSSSSSKTKPRRSAPVVVPYYYQGTTNSGIRVEIHKTTVVRLVPEE
jgi:hypothetical protein